LMNYGDGVYGGQFVGAMYSEAFFESDPETIVRLALKSIPESSQYHGCISDVLRWYHQYPEDWEKTWDLINQKYHLDGYYRRFTPKRTKDDPIPKFNIDVKINGAYIIMGLLYGEGDPDKTIIISMRCGQDSDCNPSNAAGILFTTIGYKNLTPRFISALDSNGKFSHTPYDFPKLINVCEKLARDVVLRSGGRIERDDKGREVFVIPIQEIKPSKLEQCWQPGPTANSKFSAEEMAKIKTAKKKP